MSVESQLHGSMKTALEADGADFSKGLVKKSKTGKLAAESDVMATADKRLRSPKHTIAKSNPPLKISLGRTCDEVKTEKPKFQGHLPKKWISLEPSKKMSDFIDAYSDDPTQELRTTVLKHFRPRTVSVRMRPSIDVKMRLKFRVLQSRLERIDREVERQSTDITNGLLKKVKTLQTVFAKMKLQASSWNKEKEQLQGMLQRKERQLLELTVATKKSFKEVTASNENMVSLKPKPMLSVCQPGVIFLQLQTNLKYISFSLHLMQSFRIIEHNKTEAENIGIQADPKSTGKQSSRGLQASKVIQSLALTDLHILNRLSTKIEPIHALPKNLSSSNAYYMYPKALTKMSFIELSTSVPLKASPAIDLSHPMIYFCNPSTTYEDASQTRILENLKAKLESVDIRPKGIHEIGNYCCQPSSIEPYTSLKIDLKKTRDEVDNIGQMLSEMKGEFAKYKEYSTELLERTRCSLKSKEIELAETKSQLAHSIAEEKEWMSKAKNLKLTVSISSVSNLFATQKRSVLNDFKLFSSVIERPLKILAQNYALTQKTHQIDEEKLHGDLQKEVILSKKEKINLMLADMAIFSQPPGKPRAAPSSIPPVVIFFKASVHPDLKTWSDKNPIFHNVKSEIIRLREIEPFSLLEGKKMKKSFSNPNEMTLFKFIPTQVKPQRVFGVDAMNLVTIPRRDNENFLDITISHSFLCQKSEYKRTVLRREDSKPMIERFALAGIGIKCNCECSAALAHFEIASRKLASVCHIRDLSQQNEIIRLRKKIDGFKSEPSISQTLREINQNLAAEKQALEAKIIILSSDNPDLSIRFNNEIERDNMELRSVLAVSEDKMVKLEKKLEKCKKRCNKYNYKLETLVPLLRLVAEQIFFQNVTLFSSVFDIGSPKQFFDTEISKLSSVMTVTLEDAHRADRSLFMPTGDIRDPKILEEVTAAWLLVIRLKQRETQLLKEKQNLLAINNEKVYL